VLLLLSATPLNPVSDARLPSIQSMILTAQARDITAEIDALNQQAERIRQANRAREQDINRLRNDQTRLREFEEAVATQIREIQAQLVAYNNLIDAQERAIENTRAQILLKEEAIENTELRIGQRERQIAQLDAQNQESLRRFGQIAAQMYMSSGGGGLGLLSSSSSFSDIMLHAEMLRNLSEYNTEFMNDLLNAVGVQNDAIATLAQDVEELNASRNDLDTQRLILEDELVVLERTRKEVSEEINRQHAALRTLTAERVALQQEVDGIRAQFNASAAELADVNRQIERIIREEEERRRRENNPAPDYSGNGFIWPTPGFRTITSPFGWRAWNNAMHNGIDVAGRNAAGNGINDTPIVAAQSGEVTHSGPLGSFGIVVFINHGGGYTTVYAHMIRTPPVSRGDTVVQGQTIGHVGSTGRSTGPHLHFEIRKNGTPVNPMNYFR
jgi:murein DD-endopeptidase MepM/ murein hydrolase activator NlpD